MADNIDDLKNEFQELKTELYGLSGRKITMDFDSSDIIKAQDQIDLLRSKVQSIKDAATEVADGFESTLDVLRNLNEEITRIDNKILKSSLTKEYKTINSTIKSVSFNQQNLSKGLVSQRDVLKTIKSITGSINSLEMDLTQNQSTLTKGQKEVIASTIQNLNYTKAVADQQLEMLQHSENVKSSVGDISSALSEIPGIGKLISKPFSALADSLQESSLQTQILNQELQILKQRKEDLVGGLKIDFGIKPEEIESVIAGYNQATSDISDLIVKNMNASDITEAMDLLNNDPLLLEGDDEGVKKLREHLDFQKSLAEELTLLKEQQKKYDEINNQIADTNKRLEMLPSVFQSIVGKVKEWAKSLTMMGIAAKFVQTLVKDLIAADKVATELSRKFNMSKSAALELRDSVRITNIEQGSYKITTDDTLKTMMSMLDVSGRRLALSEKDRSSAAELLTIMKLSEKATAGLAQISRINNESIDDTVHSMLGASVQLQSQTGLLIDNKQLLEDIGNLSNTLRVKFKGNTDEMALTVTKSKQLGFSMETLSQVQDNILNFESSIQAELEAELLTGKELNLEKARYYALTNQQSKLQDEIVRQVGTLNEYEKMNVFQQKAYAQALGMSVDDMSEILLKQSENEKIQQAINKDKTLASLFDGKVDKEKLISLAKSGSLSREQMKLLGSATKENLTQLSIQEKMEKVMTRLSEIFLSVMDAMTPVVELVDWVITKIGDMLSSMPKIARQGLGAALTVLGGGAFVGAIISLLTRGTIINPMITANVGVGGVAAVLGGGLASAAKLTGAAKGGAIRNAAAGLTKIGRSGGFTGQITRGASKVAQVTARGVGAASQGIGKGITSAAQGIGKGISSMGPSISKVVGVLGKFASVLGIAIESFGMITDVMNDGFKALLSGKNMGRMIGGAIGAAIGAFFGGPPGALLGASTGMWIGGMLGNAIKPAKKKESNQLSTFATPIEPSSPVESVTPMATGGIVTGPTRALVGEAGSEAVIPLDAFYRKFDELISATTSIAGMNMKLETGVIAGRLTNGGTIT